MADRTHDVPDGVTMRAMLKSRPESSVSVRFVPAADSVHVPDDSSWEMDASPAVATVATVVAAATGAVVRSVEHRQNARQSVTVGRRRIRERACQLHGLDHPARQRFKAAATAALLAFPADALLQLRDWLVSSLGFAVLVSVHSGAQRTANKFDVLITNGRIVDGTGAPWYRGDVGIVGDTIAAIGTLGRRDRDDEGRRDQSRRCAGLHRSAGAVGIQRAGRRPGREQSHAGCHDRGDRRGHVDRAAERRDGRGGRASAKHFGVAQDWRTLADYFRRLEIRSHPAINVATFVGAGGLRSYVIGKDDRPATPAELESMKRLVAAGDGAGSARSSAHRCSTCPIGSHQPTRSWNSRKWPHGTAGVYFTHQRSESARIFESIEEVFQISERAAIPAEIWHLKTAYSPTSVGWPRCSGASRPRARADSTSRPISIRTRARQTACRRACRSGSARAGSTRCWRG